MGYAEERLELIARLRANAPGGSLSDALRLDGRSLRFHVGTSLADLRVPVHVDGSIHAAMRAAVRDLFFLLAMRHRTVLRQNEYDRLILSGILTVSYQCKEPSACVTFSSGMYLDLPLFIISRSS